MHMSDPELNYRQNMDLQDWICPSYVAPSMQSSTTMDGSGLRQVHVRFFRKLFSFIVFLIRHVKHHIFFTKALYFCIFKFVHPVKPSFPCLPKEFQYYPYFQLSISSWTSSLTITLLFALSFNPLARPT